MPVANPDMLRAIHLFQMLDDEELKTLSRELDEVYFLEGQNIFSMGQPGDKMYIVESGRVELFLQDKANDRVQLGFAHSGELFGELSLLSSEPRSASARALEKTKLIAVDQNDLNILVTAHPAAALDMMAALSKRLRDTNRLVQERTIRNPNDEVALKLSLGERLSDLLTSIAGDIRFVYFSVIWFFTWIVLNTHVIPGVEPFDPYPFGFLTMVVSLEAIFLSLFVLISQNRSAIREKVRNDIEYDVNIRAGEEIRELMNRMDKFQQLTLNNFAELNARVDTSEQSGRPV
jgi:CRP/FNR family transcriptional regulator, cyclic AMP receptor protein